MIIRIITPISSNAFCKLNRIAPMIGLKHLGREFYQTAKTHPREIAPKMMEVAGEKFSFEILPDFKVPTFAEELE